MVEWSTNKPTRRRKYRPILEEVKAGQADHGLSWAEIARFRSEPAGRACAYQLKQQFSDDGYQFRSQIDQGTRECVVYARYMGDRSE